MVCNRDCFNCPFPDCINDVDTQEDIDAAERREQKIKDGWCRAERIARRQKEYRDEHREKAIESSRKYYATHKDHVKKKHAEWYQKNKERILAQQKAYRAANKDKISARKKRQYAQKKEAAQAESGTAPDRENDHINIVTSRPVIVKGA